MVEIRTCHFDVLLCVLFDIFDICTRRVVLNALSKRVILFLEAGEEVLDACEHYPSKYLEFTPVRYKKDSKEKTTHVRWVGLLRRFFAHQSRKLVVQHLMYSWMVRSCSVAQGGYLDMTASEPAVMCQTDLLTYPLLPVLLVLEFEFRSRMRHFCIDKRV